MPVFDGAGVVGALLIGITFGALTPAARHVAVAVSRAVIGVAFAVPAAIAGYHVVLAPIADRGAFAGVA